MNADDLTRSVGLRIRLRREQLGLSQEQLAVDARMDRTAIGKIERGERSVTISTLSRIAKALRVSMSRLLESLDND